MTYITHFKWTVKNAMKVASPTSPNSSIFSDTFTINGTSSTACVIFVHTKPSDPNYCSLFLEENFVDTNAQGKANYKFWIDNIDGQRIGSQVEKEFDIKRLGMFGIGQFVRRSQIYPPSVFIQDDTLIINCVVKYVVDSSKKGEDIKAISSENITSGCTLESNRKHYYVPRHLLIQRSNYFKRLLEGNTIEARTGIIHLQNISINTFIKFASFMCRGYISVNKDTAEELYQLAHRYESDQLKTACRSMCLSSRKMNDLLVCVKLGFIYGDADLKKHGIENLRSLYRPQMSLCYFGTNEWVNFAAMNLQLSLEIKLSAYKAVGILPNDRKL